jgi:parallel beta-helix repeat protein
MGLNHKTLGVFFRLACAIYTGSLVFPETGLCDTDAGNIAVVETDATILQPGEPFDLNNKTLTFTRKSGGGYTITVGALNFDSNLGVNLNLADDDSRSQSLAFTFRFFGVNYTSVFVNSNGNLTFGSSSLAAHFNVFCGGDVNAIFDPQLCPDAANVLDQIAQDFPRIAALWQDWDPTLGGGGVFVRAATDRLVVTWNAVRPFGGGTAKTFQVVLLDNGVIRISYKTVTSTLGGGYLVGISPGSGSSALVTTVDFSQGSASSISTLADFEPLVQVFGSISNPLVHALAVARRFYGTHGDDYDQLLLLSNFSQAMGNAFSFELSVQNTVAGIGDGLYDFSSFAGSHGRLQSTVTLNELACYPSDPNQIVSSGPCGGLGTNATVDLIGQEAGHQWLALVDFNNGGVCSNLLLGRDLAHWSFFHDTNASDMEGNRWQDNGNGTFTSIEGTKRYSGLDQYIMGLRPAAEVPTFFFVNNPSSAHCHILDSSTGERSCAPQTGVTVSGTRRNITLNQVISCEGARSPSSGFSGINPTSTWKQAFILVVPAGTLPQADINKIDTIRSAWAAHFSSATEGRGNVDTALTTPSLAIGDAAVTEGNAGTVVADFMVTLSPASAQTVTVNFATADASAIAGSDYVAQSGTLTFNAGDTAKTISVIVNGDTVDEGDETFFVNLASATNALIANGQGVGTIIDDDGPQIVSVSCPNVSLQQALEGAASGDTLSVTGTCNENVLVRNDKVRVFLDGGGTAVINGSDPSRPAIDVRGKAVSIQRLTITGGSDGIVVQRGANAVINNNMIDGTGGPGVVVNQQAFAVLTNNTIQHNAAEGVHVSEGSAAHIGFNSGIETTASSNTIQFNGASGITIAGSSSARVVGNMIHNNGGNGVTVDSASQADLANNTIESNERDGVSVGQNAVVNLGENSGASIFDLPNSTGSNNGGVGLACALGGVVEGRRGSLNGVSGTSDIGSDCIDTSIP